MKTPRTKTPKTDEVFGFWQANNTDPRGDPWGLCSRLEMAARGLLALIAQRPAPAPDEFARALERLQKVLSLRRPRTARNRAQSKRSASK